jgi:phosphohistidine phosphatase
MTMSYKNLFLLRHAQAFPAVIQGKDAYRLLTEEGTKSADKLGIYWYKTNVQFDKIITSPAVRTVETAKAVATHVSYPHTAIVINDIFYEGTTDAVVAQIEALDPNWQQVLIVSHQPLISALLTYLTDEAAPQLPTCSYLQVRLNIASWNAVGKGVGQLVPPKSPEQ